MFLLLSSVEKVTEGEEVQEKIVKGWDERWAWSKRCIWVDVSKTYSLMFSAVKSTFLYQYTRASLRSQGYLP